MRRFFVFLRKHWWAVALLVVLISGAISFPFVWYYLHDTNILGADQPATPIAVVPAVPETTNAFKSNMESLDDPAMKNEAQMALIEHDDINVVIADLVEKGFTSHDKAVVGKAGRKIYALYGEKAIPIMLEYTHDDRVVVREWTKKWYGHYNPGQILNRIESCEAGTTKAQADAATARAKAQEMREIGASLIQKGYEEKERIAGDMAIARRDSAAMYYGRGERTATGDIHLANAEAGTINYHQLRGEGFRLYYKGRRMEAQITFEEAKEVLPEVRTTPRPIVIPPSKPKAKPMPTTCRPAVQPPRSRW